MLLALLAVVIPRLTSRPGDPNTVVLYCAHDSIFADQILRLFEERTGIRVRVRYDEEASKSLGLTSLLIAERQQPRCDVFWNNQSLGTIRLKAAGILTPFHGPGVDRIPAAFRDSDGCWTGFAARMRVYGVNTELLEPTEEAVAGKLSGSSLADVAIAVPLYGTTLSHYSVICGERGLNGLQQWHRSLHQRGIREARGNAAVRDLVAEGACAVGFTDTDDVFAAIDQGQPVAMVPVRVGTGQTIVIPNTAALIVGGPHPEAGRKLMEFLLSEEVELLLAQSASRQIPLGPVDRSLLSPEVARLLELASAGVSLDAAAQHQPAVLEWLSAEYLGYQQP